MLFELLFPRRCLGCGQWGKYFCPVCLKKIRPLADQICPVCFKPTISGRTHARCQTKLALDGMVSFFHYEGIIKKAIKKLKYRLVTDLAQELIKLVVTQSLPAINQPSFTLVPVPLHPRRQRQRGFNQAEVLGQILARKFGWSMQTDLLIRQRHTQPQANLKKKERQGNIRGAFKVNPQINCRLPSETNYLVFDDVWTTGSTLKECGRVLKRKGAQKVWGLTLVR